MEENFQGNLKNRKIRSKPKLNLNQPKSSLIKLPQYFPLSNIISDKQLSKDTLGIPFVPVLANFNNMFIEIKKNGQKIKKGG